MLACAPRRGSPGSRPYYRGGLGLSPAESERFISIAHCVLEILLGEH